MKIVYFFSLTISLVLCLSYRNGPATIQDRGYTGAPGEPSFFVCANCHTSNIYGVTTTSLIVKDQVSGLPITAYIPGTDYDYELTVSSSVGSPNAYGFQMTAYEAGETADAFSMVSGNSQIVAAGNGSGPDRNYVEHTGLSGPTFTGVWTAPTSGTGDVVFYHVGNSVNADFGQSGDTGSNSQSTTIQEDTTVPVEMSSFQAEISGSNVDISWSTASETNNDYFNIEHSEGNTFSPITTIKASGVSDEYTYTHNGVKSGVHYYRIRQFDYDGNTSISRAVKVRLDHPNIEIYPNPSLDIININMPRDIQVRSIKLLDMSGQMILISSDPFINIGHLMKGLYILQIELFSGDVMTQKILKV